MREVEGRDSYNEDKIEKEYEHLQLEYRRHPN